MAILLTPRAVDSLLMTFASIACSKCTASEGVFHTLYNINNYSRLNIIQFVQVLASSSEGSSIVRIRTHNKNRRRTSQPRAGKSGEHHENISKMSLIHAPYNPFTSMNSARSLYTVSPERYTASPPAVHPVMYIPSQINHQNARPAHEDENYLNFDTAHAHTARHRLNVADIVPNPANRSSRPTSPVVYGYPVENRLSERQSALPSTAIMDRNSQPAAYLPIPPLPVPQHRVDIIPSPNSSRNRITKQRKQSKSPGAQHKENTSTAEHPHATNRQQRVSNLLPAAETGGGTLTLCDGDIMRLLQAAHVMDPRVNRSELRSKYDSAANDTTSDTGDENAGAEGSDDVDHVRVVEPHKLRGSRGISVIRGRSADKNDRAQDDRARTAELRPLVRGQQRGASTTGSRRATAVSAHRNSRSRSRQTARNGDGSAAIRGSDEMEGGLLLNRRVHYHDRAQSCSRSSSRSRSPSARPVVNRQSLDLGSLFQGTRGKGGSSKRLRTP